MHAGLWVGLCHHLPVLWSLQVPSPRPCPCRNLKKFRRWQCEQVRAMRGEAKTSWKRLMGVESACDVDCRFRLGTHKMVFIVNSEDYMYRRGTLCRAKQVPHPCPIALALNP